MLTDSHAHLNFSSFGDDLDEIISRCQKKPMRVINIGTQLATSQKAIEIAQNHDGFFASVGIHPIHTGEQELDEQETKEHQKFDEKNIEQALSALDKLAEQKKVVAIGETGLDYSRLPEDAKRLLELQKQYFSGQVEIAQNKSLPIILHCRGERSKPLVAYEEILELINGKNLRGVVHCFGANLALAQEFITRGFYIGFTGIITFKKKAEGLQEVARQIPLEKILIETDAPYLAPEPHRGQRNEPIYVEWTAKKIAELKSIDVEKVIETTAKNAAELFGL
ncbi:MAG: TatD family hydrolase [Patescibacteria group bacterium]